MYIQCNKDICMYVDLYMHFRIKYSPIRQELRDITLQLIKILNDHDKVNLGHFFFFIERVVKKRS